MQRNCPGSPVILPGSAADTGSGSSRALRRGRRGHPSNWRVLSDWFDNDDLFRRELAEGHAYANYVADQIRQRGLQVEVTPMEWRNTIEDRHRFSDEFDLTVGSRRRCRVDVKSRRLAFTGPDDYPWPTALVDTVSGWDAKATKPSAIVLVSQETRGLAVIRVSTQGDWVVRRRFDQVRRIEDDFYEVRRDLLASFDELVAWLRQREELPQIES
jgi:hypothetical protein